MTTSWVLIGLAIAAAVVALIASWRKSDRPPDLGTVSNQWISEHRLGSGQDLHR